MSNLGPFLVPLGVLPPNVRQHLPLAYRCKTCGVSWGTWPVPMGRCAHYGDYGGRHVEDCLNLSPPPVQAGIPQWPDPVHWACAVVAQWYGLWWLGDAESLQPLRMREGEETETVWSVRGVNGGWVALLSPGDPGHENYDESDIHQRRRVLVAVLRKGRPRGVGPEES